MVCTPPFMSSPNFSGPGRFMTKQKSQKVVAWWYLCRNWGGLRPSQTRNAVSIHSTSLDRVNVADSARSQVPSTGVHIRACQLKSSPL